MLLAQALESTIDATAAAVNAVTDILTNASVDSVVTPAVSSATSAAVTAAATTSAPQASGFVAFVAQMLSYTTNINWAVPSWDMFIILFFIVTVFLYGISLGRDRIIVILVSIYMALAVVSNAPFLGRMHTDLNQFMAFRVTSFLGLFVLLFFLLSRSAILNTFGNMASGKWWQVLVFSTFHVGLLVSITLSFMPPEAVSHLAGMTQMIFSSEGARFFWIAAPIVGMVMLKP